MKVLDNLSWLLFTTWSSEVVLSAHCGHLAVVYRSFRYRCSITIDAYTSLAGRHAATNARRKPMSGELEKAVRRWRSIR